MKNKYYFLISFILILLLFPQISLALDIVSAIGNAFKSLPFIFLSFVFSLILVLATALSWLFGGILDWVIGPNFVTINYTQPCPFDNGKLKLEGNCNPIIGIGLNITQSFVNLILIVFLIVIALAMALQYQEYGSRKTLAKLIIVALLVNFAPVLVGLIVDASNIFTYYFFSKVQNVASFGRMVGDAFGMIKTSVKTLDLTTSIGVLMQISVGIVINIVLAFVFLLFAILFIVRYIMIWVLTILSPLAIACWVLPVTKKFWDQWLKQLIHWAFVGVPLGFFLYLGVNSYQYLKAVFVSDLKMGVEASTLGVLNTVFPFFIIIAFLFLGLIFGLQTSAMGAGAIIGFATKYGKAGSMAFGRAVGRRATGLAKRATERAVPTELATRIAAYKPTSRLGRAAVGVGTAVGVVPAARWAARGALSLTENRKRTMEKAKEEGAKFQTPESLSAEIRKELGVTGDPDKALGLVGAGLKRGKEFQNAINKTLTDDEKIKLANQSLHFNEKDTAKAIAYQNLDLAEKINFEFSEEDKQKYGDIKTKLVAEIKPSEMGVLAKDFYKDDKVMQTVTKHWTGAQLGAAAQEHGKAFVDNFIGARDQHLAKILIQKNGNKEETLKEYLRENPRAALYTTSNAAQELGFTPPLEFTREEVQKIRSKMSTATPPPPSKPKAGGF